MSYGIYNLPRRCANFGESLKHFSSFTKTARTLRSRNSLLLRKMLYSNRFLELKVYVVKIIFSENQIQDKKIRKLIHIKFLFSKLLKNISSILCIGFTKTFRWYINIRHCFEIYSMTIIQSCNKCMNMKHK